MHLLQSVLAVMHHFHTNVVSLAARLHYRRLQYEIGVRRDGVMVMVFNYVEEVAGTTPDRSNYM